MSFLPRLGLVVLLAFISFFTFYGIGLILPCPSTGSFFGCDFGAFIFAMGGAIISLLIYLIPALKDNSKKDFILYLVLCFIGANFLYLVLFYLGNQADLAKQPFQPL
jgi:hypothetical protein